MKYASYSNHKNLKVVVIFVVIIIDLKVGQVPTMDNSPYHQR